jgi:hypothetical protein
MTAGGAVRAARRRPAIGWWWAAGVTTVLGILVGTAGVVLLVVGGLGGIESVVHPDAVVLAGGGPVTAAVIPGTERLLMVTPNSGAECTVTDTDGVPVPSHPGWLGTRVTLNGHAWEGHLVFTGPPNGRVVIECTSSLPGANARVVAAPSGPTTYVSQLLLLLGGAALFGVGVLWLVVLTTVRVGAGRPEPPGPPGSRWPGAGAGPR